MSDEEQIGQCFQIAAVTFLPELRELRPEAIDGIDGKLLVHGRVDGTGPCTGIRFWHAWIEFFNGQLVLDVGSLVGDQWKFIPSEEYYRAGGIAPDECVKYTQDEARHEIVRTGIWGTWWDQLEGDGPIKLPAAHKELADSWDYMNKFQES